MTIRNFSTLLAEFRSSLGTAPGRISMDQILEVFHERGFGVIMSFIALPLAFPVPKPPGMSTIFGLPLLFLTLQVTFGRHTVWMPDFIRRKTLDKAKLGKTLDGLAPWVVKIEPFLRPRMEHVTQGKLSRLSGGVGALLAFFITIPAPGTNTITAMGLALMSLGLVMRDGLAIIIGGIFGLTWVVILTSLYIYFGKEGLHALQSLL